MFDLATDAQAPGRVPCERGTDLLSHRLALQEVDQGVSRPVLSACRIPSGRCGKVRPAASGSTRCSGAVSTAAGSSEISTSMAVKSSGIRVLQPQVIRGGKQGTRRERCEEKAGEGKEPRGVLEGDPSERKSDGLIGTLTWRKLGPLLPQLGGKLHKAHSYRQSHPDGRWRTLAQVLFRSGRIKTLPLEIAFLKCTNPTSLHHLILFFTHQRHCPEGALFEPPHRSSTRNTMQ